jgi:hypothetical protein
MSAQAFIAEQTIPNDGCFSLGLLSVSSLENVFFCVEEAYIYRIRAVAGIGSACGPGASPTPYTQQGRAHIRRLHPDWAARPALMSRAGSLDSRLAR